MFRLFLTFQEVFVSDVEQKTRETTSETSDRQMSAHRHLFHADPDTMSLFSDGRDPIKSKTAASCPHLLGRQLCLKRTHGHTKDNLSPPPLAIFPKRSLNLAASTARAKEACPEVSWPKSMKKAARCLPKFHPSD